MVPGFWDNVPQAAEINQQIAFLNKQIDHG
jgi:hypothetical protein